GLARWDGTGWTFYRTSNSDIPYNYVQAITETDPGIYWVGVGLPTEPGGLLVRFDGQNWKRYNEHNSGFAGSEPLALAEDSIGRLWIGTAAGGLQIYTLQTEEE
ncbi:MAG TPA: two-component regulator propeller domain-containing protein, partial [Anaerolineaceae bacterium]|nr:two-component regulator propeller domain-containing protein [Anaerolineaceae bacterium]